MIDFGTGVIVGGLSLSACWGALWLVIGAVGAARGVCSRRVVTNGLLMSITPLLLGWGVWWMRVEGFSTNGAFVAGLLVMPTLLIGLGARRASDGRPIGLHMMEGVRHLKDQLLAAHHECGDCGGDPESDSSKGLP